MQLVSDLKIWRMVDLNKLVRENVKNLLPIHAPEMNLMAKLVFLWMPMRILTEIRTVIPILIRKSLKKKYQKSKG